MSSKWANRISQALGLRLAAWYLGTFLASTLVIGGLTYGLLATLLESRDHDIIQSTLREYATRYQAGGLPALARAIEIEQRSGTREPLFVRLVGPVQDVLLYSLPEAWGAFDLSELPGGANTIWAQVRARDRNAVLEIASIRVGNGSILQVGKTSEARNQLLANFRSVLILGAGVALMIGVIGGVFLTRSTLKPLRDLRDTVRRILHTGQTDDRVPVYGTDDAVDELSSLFNAMLARITTLIHGMRNALDHVAHDLRTPMTRLRVTAESALATNDPARHREALSDCLEESERVLSMLTTLMDISEAETGTMKLNVSQVELAKLAEEIRELYEDSAEAAGVTLERQRPRRTDRRRGSRSAAPGARQPRRQRHQIHPARRSRRSRSLSGSGCRRNPRPRHRRRHSRPGPAAHLRPPLPRRSEPDHQGHRPRTEPGPRLRRGARRQRRRAERARQRLDVYHSPAHLMHRCT